MNAFTRMAPEDTLLFQQGGATLEPRYPDRYERKALHNTESNGDEGSDSAGRANTKADGDFGAEGVEDKEAGLLSGMMNLVKKKPLPRPIQSLEAKRLAERAGGYADQSRDLGKKIDTVNMLKGNRPLGPKATEYLARHERAKQVADANLNGLRKKVLKTDPSYHHLTNGTQEFKTGLRPKMKGSDSSLKTKTPKPKLKRYGNAKDVLFEQSRMTNSTLTRPKKIGTAQTVGATGAMPEKNLARPINNFSKSPNSAVA